MIDFFLSGNVNRPQYVKEVSVLKVRLLCFMIVKVKDTDLQTISTASDKTEVSYLSKMSSILRISRLVEIIIFNLCIESFRSPCTRLRWFV